MAINVKQNNKFGNNQARFSNAGNDINIKVSKKWVWVAGGGGFISGIIISIVASYIYDFIK